MFVMAFLLINSGKVTGCQLKACWHDGCLNIAGMTVAHIAGMTVAHITGMTGVATLLA